jgi:thiopeptide-type bacteriocin biosynthesis protein
MRARADGDEAVTPTARPEACLFAALTSAREHHDHLLLDLVMPIVSQVGGHPDLDSLFFVRYAEPDWQVRFRVLGRPAWIEGSVRPRVDSAVRPFVESGEVSGVEFGSYLREWDRYGGPEGMRLAEQIFQHDSLACLDLLALERAGHLAVSRREYSMAFTERFLDLFGFDAEARQQFYREGCAWAFRDGTFREDDRPRLEARYLEIRERLGQLRLVDGGAEAERIARRCLEASRPVVDDLLALHADGRIHQSLVYLAWSYAHLHCNRLGIDTAPEAILRFLMSRLYEDGLASGPSS